MNIGQEGWHLEIVELRPGAQHDQQTSIMEAIQRVIVYVNVLTLKILVRTTATMSRQNPWLPWKQPKSATSLYHLKESGIFIRLINSDRYLYLRFDQSCPASTAFNEVRRVSYPQSRKKKIQDKTSLILKRALDNFQ